MAYSKPVIEPSLPPADPSGLYLRVSYTDALSGLPDADALERWEVAVLHARPGSDDAAVGAMVFYRVHLDRGVSAVTCDGGRVRGSCGDRYRDP